MGDGETHVDRTRLEKPGQRTCKRQTERKVQYQLGTAHESGTTIRARVLVGGSFVGLRDMQKAGAHPSSSIRMTEPTIILWSQEFKEIWAANWDKFAASV